MNKKPGYDHQKIENHWQEVWEKEGIYSRKDMMQALDPFYNLWMYPYPSGEGLHAGHAFASTGSDIYGRFMRMQGKDVFQPIGYDSFGLHSENFAIKIGEHPSKMLERTTKHYEEQLKSMGHGFDWKRTVTVSDADYYRFTQWLILKLFKAGLAYKKESQVNWCPSCKTVLADEQVIDGLCERCETKVTRKQLKQWFFRITDYGEKLLNNLQKIDWSERVVTAQRNWIGKRQWIDINYPIEGKDKTITVSTTRPDTNFGATFIVVAPEFAEKHLMGFILKEHGEKVTEYINIAHNKSETERITEGREKTGVFTGLFAVNQLNDKRMPIYVADFVLMSVGTGAVVGVPGHDKRDFEFARKFDLPIKRVVIGTDGDKTEITEIKQVQEDEGKIVNSEFLDGLDVHEATEKIMDYLEDKGWGKRVTRYHLRDWLISRQRYWGPPIPFIYCSSCAKKGHSYFNNDVNLIRKDQSDWDNAGWWPEEETNLPVLLPDITDFKPSGKGEGPLAKHPEFYEVKCPNCGELARRETDVSDTFVDSSWYFLAYPLQGTDEWMKGLSENKKEDMLKSEIIKKWLPVNLYFGGAEHSVLHLMYARFVTMVLYDLGYLDFEEPFPRFYAHGLMIKDGAKMSKSRGNVVNPDNYIEKFGADTLRLYLMFMGPMDSSPDFRDEGIEGMGRFVKRIWKLFQTPNDQISITDRKQLLTLMHQTIKKVTGDIENFHYNTAISQLMIYVNYLEKCISSKPMVKTNHDYSDIWNEAVGRLVLLLAPFTPHLSEEIWQTKFNKNDKFSSVHFEPWPSYDSKHIEEEYLDIVIQINGKVRGVINVQREKSKDISEILKLAKTDEKIVKWLDDKEIKKEIYIEGRLINFVL